MSKMKWFVSFGTLLYLIRDKKHGKEFDTDMDISIVGEHNFEQIDGNLKENGFEECTRIINDTTKSILFASYKSSNGLHLDLFFWIKVDNYYFHTYDYMRDSTDGRPSFYHFKSLPPYMFEGDTINYEWIESMSPLKIPALYGTLLDYWYPNWFTPDEDFGTSRCDEILEPKTCEGLC